MQEKATNILSGSTIEGRRIVDTGGDMLGHVYDVVLDLEDGRISFIVISTTPPATGSENPRLRIAPWELFHVDGESDDGTLVLDVERDTLETAPAFDRDERPDLTDPHVQNMVYSHYGYRTGLAA